jgi:tyrosyl-tRNA synthetase
LKRCAKTFQTTGGIEGSKDGVGKIDYQGLSSGEQYEAKKVQRIFHLGLVPDSIEEKQLEAPGVRLSGIAQLGLLDSVAEANRLIRQEAVSLNDQKVSNVKADLDLAQPGTFILKVGKRRFLKLVVGKGS